MVRRRETTSAEDLYRWRLDSWALGYSMTDGTISAGTSGTAGSKTYPGWGSMQRGSNAAGGPTEADPPTPRGQVQFSAPKLPRKMETTCEARLSRNATKSPLKFFLAAANAASCHRVMKIPKNRDMDADKTVCNLTVP